MLGSVERGVVFMGSCTGSVSSSPNESMIRRRSRNRLRSLRSGTDFESPDATDLFPEFPP